MAHVLLVARLVAAFFGTPWQDWVCWEDFWETPRYVCTYRQELPGMYIVVYGNGEDVKTFVKADIYEQ